jgi:hypothetical protein
MKKIKNIKKIYLIPTVIVIIFIVLALLLRGDEDNWIKDNRGVWIKHGNPAKIPEDVLKQQLLILEAYGLYSDAVKNKTDLINGPCLGNAEYNWVVDIVHNPRTDVDNQKENQCNDYINGNAKHYIELDTDGKLIKVN